MPNPVPEMDWIYKQAWGQPEAELLDWDTVPGSVIMYKSALHTLKQYDHTLPTGVYEGKMWRRREGNVDYLVWYGESPLPNQCSINHMPILLKETINLLTSS